MSEITKSNHGGKRKGSGAKPRTIGGILKRLPPERAESVRREITVLGLREVKALVSAALAKLEATRNGN